MRASDLDFDMLHKAAQQMEKCGGSFAKQIARAFYVADATNQRKLVNTFDEMFATYYRMYRITQIEGETQ
jgi:hypothetical protein